MPLLDPFECEQTRCRRGRTKYHEKVTKSHGTVTGAARELPTPSRRSGNLASHLMKGDPMAITPDTKNWTWVLDRPCPDCGFDPAIVDYRDIPRLVMENASAWPTALAGGRP